MSSSTEKQITDDLEILEELKMLYYEAIKKNKQPPKVGDLLKIIEMKNKLSVSGKAERKFWDMINKVREEGLSGKKKSKSPKQSSAK